MDIFDLATDETAEVEGRWLPFGDGSVRVARAGNEKYLRTVAALMDEAAIDLSKADPDTESRANEILVQATAKAILKDWKGLSFQKAPIEYSLENAVKLLKVREFRRRIEAMAADFNNFRLQAEEAQGNG